MFEFLAEPSIMDHVGSWEDLDDHDAKTSQMVLPARIRKLAISTNDFPVNKSLSPLIRNRWTRGVEGRHPLFIPGPNFQNETM